MKLTIYERVVKECNGEAADAAVFDVIAQHGGWLGENQNQFIKRLLGTVRARSHLREAVNRLQKKGLIDVSAPYGRKYLYRLTEKGWELLMQARKEG